MKIRSYVAFLLVLTVACFCSGIAAGESPTHRTILTIENGIALEHELAVQAFEKVVEFYEQLGYALPEDSHLTVMFQDPIHVKGKDILYAQAIYDPSTRTIRMIRFEAERFQNSTILGQNPSLEVYYSILAHECAHFVNTLICPKMDVIIDEAVACYVQLSLMERGLRDTILSRINGMEFRTYRQINMGAYIADADRFVVASYRFCLNHPKLLMRFLDGRIAPVKDPLLME